MSKKSEKRADEISCSMTKSKHEETEIKTIEKHIQNLLNLLIKGLQLVNTADREFELFQKLFVKSETLEEYLSGLHAMLSTLVDNLQDDLSSRQPQHALKEKKKKEKNASLKSISANLGNSNYENLEKVLQKYEAEIREHIRIEQQLKIYSDGLEEKLNEREKERVRVERKLKDELECLRRENVRLWRIKEGGSGRKRELKGMWKVQSNLDKDVRFRSCRKVGWSSGPIYSDRPSWFN